MYVPNLVQIRLRGGLLRKLVKYTVTIVNFYPLFRELTYRSDRQQIFALEDSNDVDSRKENIKMCELSKPLHRLQPNFAQS